MQVKIPMSRNFEKLEVHLSIGGTFHGKKSYIVCQNGKVINSGQVNGEKELTFQVTPNANELSFDILFPDAQIISDAYKDSTDGRKVAFQLINMIIKELK